MNLRSLSYSVFVLLLLFPACDGETIIVRLPNPNNQSDAGVEQDAKVDATEMRAEIEENLRIGVMLPDVNQQSTVGGEFQKATQLAADIINAAGGIRGKEVELYFKRDPDIIETAVQNFRDLISDEDAHAVIGPVRPIPAHAVNEIAQQTATPYISAQGGYGVDFATAEDAYGKSPAFPLEVDMKAATLLGEGSLECETFGMIIVDRVDQASRDAALASAMGYVEAAGLQWGGHAVVTPSAPSEVENFKAAFSEGLPDCISAEFRTIEKFIRDFPRAFPDNDVKQIYHVIPSKDTLSIFGVTDTTHVLDQYALYISSLDHELNAGFAELYETEFGEAPEYGDATASYFEMVVLIALAVEEAGSLAGPDIRRGIATVGAPDDGDTEITSFEVLDGIRALRAGNGIDYRGVFVHWDFNEFGALQTSQPYSLTKMTEGLLENDFTKTDILDTIDLGYTEE